MISFVLKFIYIYTQLNSNSSGFIVLFVGFYFFFYLSFNIDFLISIINIINLYHKHLPIYHFNYYNINKLFNKFHNQNFNTLIQQFYLMVLQINQHTNHLIY